ncbi:olfactory receptor 1046 isoform X1 [Mus musculus]|uniref:olfactory receptor 1046 isoform X1 n=1 Tax=Mus musculus TaxID=10090 RepID=UPI0007ECE64D|nr:olfactory receptor 1046 isoform X1 [Mus musculus]|eukprot:XP_017173947.1 PREDICTED: olfactory receptor 1046 isoform X1 [Mus musculus]
MEKSNHSARIQVTEFILLGLTNNPGLKAPLFVIFLIIYLVTLMGNLGMVILTHVDSKLHTPMYFFLRHLSITDLGYSTVIGPKMMVNFVMQQNIISYTGCAVQLTFFEIFIITELFILSAMAYDRYVAICKPLLYVIIMAGKVRWGLVLVPYLYSLFVSLLLTVKLFTLSFCGSNIISYFYCDCVPLISLLCSDTHELELIILIFSGCNLLSSLLIVLVSYMFIFVAILRMNSKEGRSKAFSTCSSHLTVVVVFYGTLLFIYLQPKSSHTFEIDKMASVFYTLVIPMLNPLIYSLRNKEVKEALKRTLNHRCLFSIESFHKM